MKYAPRNIFDQILEWSVIPTFDLVLEYGDQGVILIKRKIPPYKNQWALPGLRIYKGETIDETLKRIAKNDLGLSINPKERIFLGQYVGKFRTEHDRQDLSTGYLIHVDTPRKVTLDREKFSSYQFTKAIPHNTGAMYRYYLTRYFDKDYEEDV